MAARPAARVESPWALIAALPARAALACGRRPSDNPTACHRCVRRGDREPRRTQRSEEHTSELQSLTNLVCRLLLEKKNKNHKKKQIYQRQLHHCTQISCCI